MKSLRSVFALALGASLLALPATCHALDITFATVADTATAIPDGSGNFLSFVPPDPVVPTDEMVSAVGAVGFFGTGAGGQQGLYLVPPDPVMPLLAVADLNTAIPDGTGNFTGFGGPSISGENVAFFGSGAGGQQGVYSKLPSDPMMPIADLNTAIPGGLGSFTSFSPFTSVDGDAVAFIGYGLEFQAGVYVRQSVDLLNVIADTNTEIPGGTGNFVSWPPNPCSLVNGAVAFIGLGSAGQAGVYVKIPGDPMIPVADTSTPVPDGSGGDFMTFSTVSFDGMYVAFVAMGTEGEHGVYKAVPDGPPSRVADLTTVVPGGIGMFLDFGHVMVDPGVVVFVGLSDNGAGGMRHGLYTDLGGSLNKIIATGDTLGGKTVTGLHFGPGGFAAHRVVFTAEFSDGSQAIAQAEVCEALEFAGFLDPIGGADATGGTVTDPLRAFKLKSTIPVKMRLTHCVGSPVTTGTHTIQLIKWTSSTDADAPINATPTDAATTGNAFRLTDAATGEWHFNLDTKAWGMSKGTWQIKVTLSGGSVHTAFISLK